MSAYLRTSALDENARQAVLQAIQRARELQQSIERPPITPNERLCIRCSLAPVCLPEEERMVEDDSWQPIRLFPPDRETKTIHVIEQGATISRSGETLEITAKSGEKKTYPVHEVGSLVLHGYPQITTQALYLCTYHNIFVHWVSYGGTYFAGLAHGAGYVQRRLRQYHSLCNKEVCLGLTRRLIQSKVESSLKYLLRITQKKDRAETLLQENLSILRSCLSKISTATEMDSIRGYEGLAARAYFATFFLLLKSEVPETMRASNRNRRPPKDRLNALLSFGYSLLYQSILQAIMVVGLEPAIGFFHTPRSSAYPLVLDLMELFRLPLWDLVVIGSINRMQWDPIADFNISEGRVWLSYTGRKKAIELFEKRLEEQWKHPVVGHSLSYARLIELEIRLLEKEWTGQPGLFAKMRLR